MYNIVFTALHKCLYPLHIHCTENLKFVTLRFSWRQINSWSQPNWQLTNEKWSFFVLALSFVLCFALLFGMCELQAPESRLIAELLDDKIESVNGLKPASLPTSVFEKVVCLFSVLYAVPSLQKPGFLISNSFQIQKKITANMWMFSEHWFFEPKKMAKTNGSYRHFAFSAKDTPMFTDHVFNWLANHTDGIFIKARQNDILWFYSLY